MVSENPYSVQEISDAYYEAYSNYKYAGSYRNTAVNPTRREANRKKALKLGKMFYAKAGYYPSGYSILL